MFVKKILFLAIAILFINNFYSQVKDEINIKLFEKKLYYLDKYINNEFKYQLKINELINIEHTKITLSTEDSNNIYRSSKFSSILDSLFVVYNTFCITIDENQKIKEKIDILEVKSINLTILKHHNRILLDEHKNLSKKISDKVDLYNKRVQYLNSLIPDISLPKILPDNKLADIWNNLKNKGFNMQDFTSIEDVEKMGFQTPRKVKNHLNNESNLVNAFDKNVQKQLDEYLPQNSKKYFEEIKNIDKEWEKIRKQKFEKKNVSYKIKPFSHRFSYNGDLSFNRTNDSKGSSINIEGSIQYNVSDYFYINTGGTYLIQIGNNIRNLQINFGQIQFLATTGVNFYDFFSQITFQKSLQTNSLLENINQGDSQLYFGLGRRFKLSDSYTYNIFMGYDLLWRQEYNVSPFVFKIGFSRI